MEQQVDAPKLQMQHAVNGAPAHAPDDVGSRENYGFFLLTEAIVRQAQADLRHRCWPSGCKSDDDCARRKLTAKMFLRALRHGRAPLWSDWVAAAQRQANLPRVWRP